ncbi:MAG: LysM peptidoglycan-binding domain-containing protein [Pseudobdellovibrionaceae bacterium]
MQQNLLKISFMILVSTLSALAQDTDPDLKKEERFHRIYKKYNQEPTSEEAWEKVLAGRQANTYPIQNKDTLWDISQTLFGDSSYWPKVWSYNTEDIQNPHQITAKQVIKFYPGTLAEAPTIGLANKGDAPEALPTHVLEKNVEGKLEGFKIPPPKHKSRPLVKKLPDSLPLYRLGAVNKPPLDFEISGIRAKYSTPLKYLSFYITDTPLNPVGEVVEMEHVEEETSGDYEAIVVRVNNAEGKQFVAFKDETTVSDPLEFFAAKAQAVEVLGEIEIQERVNDEDNLYRALVRKSINPLEVGAKLLPGKMGTFDSGPSPLSSSVQARIIGGEYARFDQKMFGTDNIVFLNAGMSEGLKEGSSLPIYLNERLRKPDTKAMTNDRVIGEIKIIKLANHFSTGYIVDSQSPILVGDYVGSRAKAPSRNAAGKGEEASPSLDDDLQL